MTLYLVTERNEVETPLFCSERTKDVAEFLGYSMNCLYSRISKSRKKGDSFVAHGKLVHIVHISDEEYKEVISEEA